MIYLFSGSDTEKIRSKALQWIAAARLKEPNLVYLRIAGEDITKGFLEEVTQSGSLFAKRTLTMLDNPFQTSESGALIEEHIGTLASCENVIVLLAPNISTQKAEKIAVHASKRYNFDATKKAPARGFNSALVNALAKKDAIQLWIEIHRALRAGDAPEMIHGLLHWKSRDIMLKGDNHWSIEEARELSLSLIALIQNSRRKGLPLNESLERFALSF